MIYDYLKTVYSNYKSENNNMIVQYLDCARYCRRVMLCSIRLYFFSIFLAYYAANCYETYQKQNMCMFSNSFHFSTTGLGVYIFAT
jgi:hypothetical protein